jgi:Tol biopolymer transport system component
LALLITAIALAACTSAGTGKRTFQSTATTRRLPPPPTSSPKRTPAPTITVTATIPTPTPTINLTSNVAFKALKIADLLYIGHIFWAEDGGGIYYQILESKDKDDPEETDWYFFDLATEENQKLESPPDTAGKARNVSPSGRYKLEEEKVEPHVYAIWFVDTIENKRTQLLDRACGLSYDVQWSEDEHVVLFFESCTGATPIYLLDTSSHIIANLSEITDDHPGYTSTYALLSRDGQKLAIMSNPEGYLQVIFLEDGNSIKQPHPYGEDKIWSHDNNKLIYWTGSSLRNTKTELRAYDLTSGDDLLLLTMDQVFNAIDAAPCDVCITAFSPDGTGFLLRWSEETQFPNTFPLWVIQW